MSQGIGGISTGENSISTTVNSTIDGLHHVDGDEITVSLGNITYTAKDQVGSDSYEITNGVNSTGGRSILNFLTIQNTIVTDGKLDLDIVFWESAPTTSSSDGTAFDLTVANIGLYQGHVELRENHWMDESGTADRIGVMLPQDLGLEVKADSAATSIYFSVIWRGLDLAVGASEELNFKFGFLYLD